MMDSIYTRCGLSWRGLSLWHRDAEFDTLATAGDASPAAGAKARRTLTRRIEVRFKQTLAAGEGAMRRRKEFSPSQGHTSQDAAHDARFRRVSGSRCGNTIGTDRCTSPAHDSHETLRLQRVRPPASA